MDCWLWQTAFLLSELALPCPLHSTLCLSFAQVAADKHQWWCNVMQQADNGQQTVLQPIQHVVQCSHALYALYKESTGR